MTRLWKSSLTPWCLLPPRVHVLLYGLCGWKVRPLWPSSALHCGRNPFFLLDGRGTDEPKPPIRHPLRMVWVSQTPHPSSVTDGIGKWPGQPSHGQTVTVTQKRIGLLCKFWRCFSKLTAFSFFSIFFPGFFGDKLYTEVLSVFG